MREPKLNTHPDLATAEEAPARVEMTLRAVLTGMLIGSVLSLCNIYAGLKIGWGFNMSITAALIGYGFWQGAHALVGTRKLGLLENNINQTTASAAASISSAGLVAPIPAWTIITGESLSWPVLAIWVLAVASVGVVVALGIRRQMLLVDKLPFPNGIAAAETLKEMYAKGREAIARVKMLLSAALFAASLKIFTHVMGITATAPTVSFAAKGKLLEAGHSGYTLKNLGFAFDPSVLLVGVGALIGMRACVSLLLGAILAWGVIGPQVLEVGYALPPPGDPNPDALWYGVLLEWLLWPGVAMMVTASLTSLAFSWRSIVNSVRPRRRGESAPPKDPGEVPSRIYLVVALGALVFATVTQTFLFEIALWTAVVGVILTFCLAVVAGRVSGETGITPVGAMGKITQLMFGGIAPGNATANLMAANVTGGAASQCGDLLHDLKTGHLVGATPKWQALGQACGIFAGAVVGAFAYTLIVPDPAAMLLTAEWPAPAVAAWKAVAEVFQQGFGAMPDGALQAMIWAGAVGIVLAVMERVVPKNTQRFVPSPASIGLAFVIPAFNCISIFMGGVLGLFAARVAKTWATRFVIVLAAGLIAGESLSGVGLAVHQVAADIARRAQATSEGAPPEAEEEAPEIEEGARLIPSELAPPKQTPAADQSVLNAHPARSQLSHEISVISGVRRRGGLPTATARRRARRWS